MEGLEGAKTGSIFLTEIISIYYIILPVYSTCFCTVGANDKQINREWFKMKYDIESR